MTTPLVLLPGMDGSGRLFAPFIAALPPHRHAHIARYPDSMTGYEEIARYAERFLPPGPCVLVAESFSGPVAAMLAAQAPDRVKALVFAASFVAAPLPAMFRSLVPLFYGPAVPRWLLSWVMASKATPAATLDVMMEILQEAPDDMWRGRLTAAMSVDARQILRDTHCPMLVLQAGRDRLLGPAAFALLKVRPCVAIRAPGQPHLLLQSAPQQAVAAIEDFLKMSGIDAGTEEG